MKLSEVDEDDRPACLPVVDAFLRRGAGAGLPAVSGVRAADVAEHATGASGAVFPRTHVCDPLEHGDLQPCGRDVPVAVRLDLRADEDCVYAGCLTAATLPVAI